MTQITTYRGQSVEISYFSTGTGYQYHIEGQGMETRDERLPSGWRTPEQFFNEVVLEPIGCLIRDGKIVERMN